MERLEFSIGLTPILLQNYLYLDEMSDGHLFITEIILVFPGHF